jgi:predicted extracellular nuclease
MAVITQWTFEGDVITPATGTGTASLVGGTTATFATGNGGGRGWNTTTYPAQGTGNKTSGVQFTVPTTGFKDIQVSFDLRHSNTAANTVVFQYSPDGVNFTDSLTFKATAGDTFFTRNVDLTAITALNNNANTTFRILSAFDPPDTGTQYVAANSLSTYSPSGTMRYDNVTISGTAISTPTPTPGGSPPTIVVNTATTNDRLDGGALNLLPVSTTGAVSGVINDPTDPARFQGIDFTISDPDTPIGNLTVTATSSNSGVVPNANLNLTGSGATRNLKITPTGVGFSDITVTVSDGTNTATYVIKYAASAASVNPATTRFLTGASDASTAIPLDSNFVLVADDEDQKIRLYDRTQSGLPINQFDFTTALNLTDISGGVPREVDIEASTRLGSTIFWLGSHSNSSGGANRPNRSRLFTTNISGSGAGTTLTFGGYYQHLKTDLINWDNNNGHGLGAGFLGLGASAATGVQPELPNGFNIEGLTFAPDNTTAYVAFRAPQLPTFNRTQAVIVPVTNFTSLPNSTGGTPGSAVFGAPIFMDLGGRGIRSIDRNSSNEYIIVAGPAGAATGVAPNDFRLYTWNGNPSTPPQLTTANLTALNASGGSFESIVSIPNPLTLTSQIELLVDNGDTTWYGTSTISKDLPERNHQKFRRELVSLNTVPINVIQGTGTTSPLVGQTVTIEGIVVGDFQGSGQIGGFFVQEEDSDADTNPLTSEGIQVFSAIPVNVGDKVRVTGTVTEFGTAPNTITQLSSVTGVTVLGSGNPLPTPATVNLPVANVNDLERFEGMQVTFPQTLTVSETFNLARFGELQLSVDGRRFQPTEFIDPNDNPRSGTNFTGNSNVAAVTAQQDLNNRRAIILDDGLSIQNPATVPFLNSQNTRRVGDTVTGLTGVLDQRFGSYRVQPTGSVTFADTNPRPTSPPNVGNANVKVGSFNLLNYFTTLDNGTNLTGPNNNLPPRGANNITEFNRQREKTATTIAQLNADILGLIELENNGTTAISDLVNAVNSKLGANVYQFIPDPVGYNSVAGGDDAIKVGFIYKPSVVTPIGPPLTTNDPSFLNLGRAPVAQTFQVNSNGAVFTPIINHFKSKGDTGATGANLDQNDGQGAFNAQRRLQAEAIVNFVNNVVIPTSGDPDVLVIGDLNAYGEEDPVDRFRANGFVDLIDLFDGDNISYSFVFQGQSGRLDHALATPSLAVQATGAAEWHINADEPRFLDYNLEFKNGAGGDTPDFFNPNNPFRTSDHDPVLVGLNLSGPFVRLLPRQPIISRPNPIFVPGLGNVVYIDNPNVTIVDANGNILF